MAKKNIKDDIEKILISGDEIEEIVGRISANVDDYYRDRDSRLLLLGILKGSVVFMGELMKKITVPVEIDFMKVSSYGGGTSSSGSINIILDLYRKDLSNTDILIVEPNVHEHPVFKPTGVRSISMPTGSVPSSRTSSWWATVLITTKNTVRSLLWGF